MKLKEIFRFPETLLPLSIILGPSIVRSRTIDIQIYDTYFVFGGSRWGNAIFAPFFAMMVETWVLHIILRRKGSFSERWCWVQVITTVISWLAVIVILVVPPGKFVSPNGTYLDYSNYGRHGSSEGTIYLAPLIIFFLNQPIFWIVATIRITSARGGRRHALERTS